MPVSDFMHDGDLVRRVDKLERLLMEVLSGRSLQSSSVTVPDTGLSFRGGGHVVIEGGSGLDVNDRGEVNLNDGSTLTLNGGSLRLTSQDGAVGVAYLGPTTGGNSVWQFSFPNGDVAFGLLSSSGNGYWGGLDNAGHVLISTDSQTGVGLAKPYFNIPMVPSSGTSVGTGGPFWPAFTNTSYQEVMHCITTLWHPRISIGVGTNASSGTVDWQLQIDGNLAGSGSGTTSGTFNVPGWGDSINPDGAAHSVQLWCRNTSGVQSRVIVDRCYGLQS